MYAVQKREKKYTQKKVQISILINRKESACVGFHVNITNTTLVYIEAFQSVPIATTVQCIPVRYGKKCKLEVK